MTARWGFPRPIGCLCAARRPSGCLLLFLQRLRWHALLAEGWLDKKSQEGLLHLQGPEHSSARLERYLQMVDENPYELPKVDESKWFSGGHLGGQIQKLNWQVMGVHAQILPISMCALGRRCAYTGACMCAFDRSLQAV